MNDDFKIYVEAGQPVAAPTCRPIRMRRLLRGAGATCWPSGAKTGRN